MNFSLITLVKTTPPFQPTGKSVDFVVVVASHALGCCAFNTLQEEKCSESSVKYVLYS